MILVTCLFVSYYLFYLFLFYLKLDPGKKFPVSHTKYHVSVVIAARNEEKSIGLLLTTLLNQSYPSELYEVIVADDGSTDKTAAIVEEFSHKHSSIILHRVSNREMVSSPKKNALEQAIQKAKNEIIITTDADCRPTRFWLEAMILNFHETVDMVVGFSKTDISWGKATFIQKFEHIDFLNLLFAAAGAIQAEKYFSCSGQNIAYRKEAFEQVHGFEKIKHLISGDDVNLMQLFRKFGKKITFSFYPESFMKTNPCNSWQQFFNQRIRWASNMKWQFQLNIEFYLYLLSVLGTVIAPIILLFFHWKIALMLLIIRFFSEFLYVKKAMKIFHISQKRLSFFPLWFLFQPFYMMIVAVGGQGNLFRWKK